MKNFLRLSYGIVMIAALMLTSCQSTAQVISKQVEKIDGTSYFIHTVEKGQTLYAISKLYQCDINDITTANPGTDQGLKEGSQIKIPVNKSKVQPAASTTPANEKTPDAPKKNPTNYTIHIVKKKETLFSIAKQYGVDINELVAANPGADQGISKDQELRIPAPKSAMSEEVKPANGERIHTVDQGETLYSISKKYGVDVNELIAVNPGSGDGISRGQKMRIPASKSAISTETKNGLNPQKHIVVAGETLYSIAKKYGVTVESIQQANGGLGEGLHINQELLIPGADPIVEIDQSGTLPEKKETEPIHISGSIIKEKYNIALMLPFYTIYKDTMEAREKMLQEVALQMYRGTLMAADTLETLGFKGDFYTYDVLDGRSSITTALEKPEMKNMDIIIGPIFKDAMTDAAVWGNHNGVHLVCPVQQPNRVLLSSPNMTKSVASTSTQWIAIARHIFKTNPNANLIIIDSKNIDDRRSIDAFSEEWKKLNPGNPPKIIVVANASEFNVQEKYAADKKNIIIAPTSDKKVISTLFRVLGDGAITVYGNEEWDNMEVIKASNRNKYNVHFPQTTFIDYNDVRVQKWVEAFRKKFKSEPNQYAFIGFDIAIYYGMALKQFGRDFPNHLSEVKVKNLYSTGFDYLQTSTESGFENQFVMIIGTKDYTLVKEN